MTVDVCRLMAGTTKAAAELDMTASCGNLGEELMI